MKKCGADIYPLPVFEPVFGGPVVPRLYTTKKNVSKPYFEKYRNDVISRYMAPYYEWDGLCTEYSPKPRDHRRVGKQPWEKMFEKPSINLTFFNCGDRRGVDDYFLACQFQRQWYNDNTGLAHPLDFFKPREFRWQCPSEMNPTYASVPPMYVKYKQPLTLPLYMGRTWSVPLEPHRRLAGKRKPDPDLVFPK